MTTSQLLWLCQFWNNLVVNINVKRTQTLSVLHQTDTMETMTTIPVCHVWQGEMRCTHLSSWGALHPRVRDCSFRASSISALRFSAVISRIWGSTNLAKVLLAVGPPLTNSSCRWCSEKPCSCRLHRHRGGGGQTPVSLRLS